MGRSYWFECGRCGYRAKVSGSADRGKDFFIQTILCRDCKRLYDAVTQIRFPKRASAKKAQKRSGLLVPGLLAHRGPPKVPPLFEAMLARLPATSLSRFRWVRFALQCPVSSRHQVETWNEPAMCPRCGVYLERTVLPYRHWE
jgi:ribosomal protein S27AE